MKLLSEILSEMRKSVRVLTVRKYKTTENVTFEFFASNVIGFVNILLSIFMFFVYQERIAKGIGQIEYKENYGSCWK